MPTKTYKALANVTLGAAAASVTFGSIPATYRDLVLIINGSTSANADVVLRFNSDDGSNYSFVYAAGNGTTAISGAAGSQTSIVLNAYFWRSTEVASLVINIMDYSATDKHKTVLSRNNVASAGGVDMFANRWANTAAITSVQCRPFGVQNFASGCTFAVYGIEA
jgi:hypothetical protein